MTHQPSKQPQDPQARPLDSAEARDLDSLIGASAGAPPPAPGAPPPAPPPPAAGAPPADLPAAQAPPADFDPTKLAAYPTRPPKLPKSGGPGWTMAIVFLVAGLVVGAGVAALASSGSEPAVPAPSATASAPPAPPSSAEAPTPAPSPLDQAARGDDSAMKAIEAKPAGDRTVDEVMALGQGRRAHKIAEMRKLAATLEKSPELAQDPQMLKRLRRDAKDGEIAHEVLRILAGIPGPGGVDVLYDIWVGTRGKTPTTELAKELVFSKDVRPKASPALAIALDLRTTQDCDAMAKVVVRAAEKGDTRSIGLLAKLMRKYGCGEKKSEDCFPCLRSGAPKAQLKAALKETRKRPGPRF